jgi:hypothetical protein
LAAIEIYLATENVGQHLDAPSVIDIIGQRVRGFGASTPG